MTHLNPNNYLVRSWLESKIVDPCISSKYEVDNFYSNKNENKDFDKYYYYYYYQQDYTPEDPDLKSSDKFCEEIFNKDVFIHPGTNQYLTNYLFKKLVDYCEKNNFKYNDSFLIDKYFKNSFYKFCYNNSKKSI